MQTLTDISIEKYGNPEAVAVLIEDNPQRITDSVEFDLMDDVDLSGLIIREEDDLKDKKILKELDGKTIIS